LTMHAIGTERQRAVIAAFKVKPEATHREIAQAAGVHLRYVSFVLRDYRASKAREKVQVCQVPVRRASMPVSMDVASFALDKRFGGNAGPAARTAKQQALNAALAKHPRMDAEPKMDYCRRIAAIAGVSYPYVHRNLQLQECSRIGAELRAKEAEEAKSRCQVMAPDVGLGPVQNFRGWIDVFSKLKILAEAYLNLARTRGDVYATAFLSDIRDVSDRAQRRATSDVHPATY
jgi:hypothetical protein